MGLGRLGGLPSRKGWAADRRALVCGVVGLSGAGIGDTPAVVGCCGCCGRGGLLWWVPLVRAGVRVGGGMLSGFWGSAPWLPGPCFCCLLVGGGVWVWVGWL